MTPHFLDLWHVLQARQRPIERYGGSAGIRDPGLLHSAISMPQASFGGEYLHKDVFDMAAAYLYHIIQNHPFVDGNKRAGAAAAIIFLAMNDIQIEADEEGLVNITLRVATGESGKSELADFSPSGVTVSERSMHTTFCRANTRLLTGLETIATGIHSRSRLCHKTGRRATPQ
jgi:death-on-curing protein